MSNSAFHLRHVFSSALSTVGLAPNDMAESAASTANALRMEPAEQVVVILVDGLGLELLDARKGHVPTLRSFMNPSYTWGPNGMEQNAGVQELTTCFPSTTAAALTTLGTGALPGQTGMLGYSVRHPGHAMHGGHASTLNLITWEDTPLRAENWQDHPTLVERSIADHGEPLYSVGPARFTGSGLTGAAFRAMTHVGVDRLDDRPAAVHRLLQQGARMVYMYVGELDHAGHAHGWQSEEWLFWLERLDIAVATLIRKLPSNTAVYLTADHGMVDTDAAHRITLTDSPVLMTDVEFLAGEPRMTHLYLSGHGRQCSQEFIDRWREVLGERIAWIGTAGEAQSLVGPLSTRAREVMGDVIVAMNDSWVLVDPRVHSTQAMELPGVHGSLTHAETAIPLLTIRA
ncbi:alkaline phosphatase family protein [Actinomyces vulturis]|uniref:alkaline phosphatase family protein n=1 Tax=Actinomyces vulturis TaxID=1857645 RepID=UPI00082C0BEB|nr:alkaline phosphatase family protein [Actinomyces vulturis]